MDVILYNWRIYGIPGIWPIGNKSLSSLNVSAILLRIPLLNYTFWGDLGWARYNLPRWYIDLWIYHKNHEKSTIHCGDQFDGYRWISDKIQVMIGHQNAIYPPFSTKKNMFFGALNSLEIHQTDSKFPKFASWGPGGVSTIHTFGSLVIDRVESAPSMPRIIPPQKRDPTLKCRLARKKDKQMKRVHASEKHKKDPQRNLIMLVINMYIYIYTLYYIYIYYMVQRDKHDKHGMILECTVELRTCVLDWTPCSKLSFLWLHLSANG